MNYLVKGGPVMIPLFLVSLLALTLIIERFLYFKKNDDFNENDFKIIKAMIIIKNYSEAKSYLSKFLSPIAKTALMLIDSVELSKDDRENLLDIESMKQERVINRFLPILKILPNLATLLGLLGTVTGMIKNFMIVAQIGTGDPTALASGISEALITTATGLIIAIPTVFFYTLLDNKADNLEKRLYIFINEINKIIL
ncbi:MAG: MotA/TolQ/ExbB proton channel family protein [Spirochaetales bacterium]|nr:MotA/TolQ/ExbB proton channel family protein [Spirochaetales bacterium]